MGQIEKKRTNGSGQNERAGADDGAFFAPEDNDEEAVAPTVQGNGDSEKCQPNTASDGRSGTNEGQTKLVASDSSFDTDEFTEELKCRQGIPLAVPLPKDKDLCQFLGERRKSFYRLLDSGVLFRHRTKGLKEGVTTVYGPSVCDAKYGCRCGYRHRLKELRAAWLKLKGNE